MHPAWRSHLRRLSVTVAALTAGAACTSSPSKSRPATSGQVGKTTACSSPAPLSVGLDAFRSLDHLSYLDLVSRTAGATTADPAGTNADWSHPVRVLPNGGRVLLDQVGPGIVTFLRMQEQLGGPWALSIDGGLPVPVRLSDFGQTLPSDAVASALRYPLSLSPSESQGSSLVMSSLAFSRSLTWTSAAKNGNFYSLWRKLPLGVPLASWSTTQPVADVAGLLARGAGQALPVGLSGTQGTFTLPASAETNVVTLSGQGQRQIRELHFRVPFNEKVSFGNSKLRIYWDGEGAPSVDAPIKSLVGDGAGVYQPAGRPLVAGFLGHAGGDGATYMDYDLYWPMPYRRSARIDIESTAPGDVRGIRWSVGSEPYSAPIGWWAPFHASSTSAPTPQAGTDMTFLDVRGSGRLVGTVLNFGAIGATLEGDPHIYVDDADTPQVQATGTEEWGLGGDYWNGGVQTSLPLGGFPSSTNNPPGTDIEGAAEYRFLLADSITFNRHAVLRWEHGSVDDVNAPYTAVVLWYGTPTVTALLSDDLTLGSSQQAATHHLDTQGASRYDLTAGYVYSVRSAAITQQVVASAGSTSFTMKLAPGAAGAFLRRTSDWAAPDQRADVLVDGVPAGTWYSPGSFAGRDPGGLARRFVEDEFPLPPGLVSRRSSLRIEVRNHPTSIPQSGPWTATRYQLYSMVPPGC